MIEREGGNGEWREIKNVRERERGGKWNGREN